MSRREWCPGSSDYALDAKWHPERRKVYWCVGCGRWLKIPERGHRVGLVPNHKRDRSAGTFFPYSSEG